MRTHWCVDPAGTAQPALRDGPCHFFVQWLAHAVQALKFILPGVVVLAGHFINGCHTVGVVRRELRVDDFGYRKQLARTSQVGNVTVYFSRVDGVAFQAILLGALDFAVPVGTFDQSDHQAMMAATPQVDQVVEHEGRPFLISLHHEA